jgi:hypothetical protein
MDIDSHLSKSLEPAPIPHNQKVSYILAFGSVVKIIDRIRNNRQLDISGKKFKFSNNLIYPYVKAMIITKINQLQLYLDDDLVQKFEYQILVYD